MLDGVGTADDRVSGTEHHIATGQGVRRHEEGVAGIGEGVAGEGRLGRCRVAVLLGRNRHMDVGEGVVGDVERVDTPHQQGSTVCDAVRGQRRVGPDVADGVAGEVDRAGVEYLEDAAGRLGADADVPDGVARDGD